MVCRWKENEGEKLMRKGSSLGKHTWWEKSGRDNISSLDYVGFILATTSIKYAQTERERKMTG